MKKELHYILLVLGILLTAGCEADLPVALPPETGEAQLTMTISTRSVTPGDGMVETGGGMKNLMVLLVDNQNIIVDGMLFNDIPATQNTQKTITFSNLLLGTYHLYAYANKEGLNFTKGGTFTQQDQAFTELSGTAAPDTKGNQSLLTASTLVTIKVGENQARLEMLRTVARFRMLIFNHSTSDIYITNLDFGTFNSSTSYLFSHNGDVPASNSYRQLPAYSLTGEDRKIVANGTKQVYATYLYESKATNQYHFNMGLTIGQPQLDNWQLQASSINNNKQVYTLSSGKNYMVDNNGTLGVIKESNLGNLGNTKQNFYWIIKEVNGGVTVQNAATKNYIQITQKETSSGFLGSTYEYKISTTPNSTTLSSKVSGTQVAIFKNFVESGWRDKNVTKYLTINNNISLTDTEKMLNTQYPFNDNNSKQCSNQQIVTVNRQTAAVNPLTKISRNQDIRVIINVYYNDKNDKFNFEVLPWEKETENVEFN